MVRESGNLKYTRQAAIVRLIEREKIGTQNELMVRLLEEGFEVTQATISRDIRELRLVKVADEDGDYRYDISRLGDKDETVDTTASIFLAAVDKVDFANNLVVVKCFPGMAQAVCATIDGMDWPNIVGTVSGDDTILIVTRTEESAVQLMKLLKEIK